MTTFGHWLLRFWGLLVPLAFGTVALVRRRLEDRQGRSIARVIVPAVGEFLAGVAFLVAILYAYHTHGAKAMYLLTGVLALLSLATRGVRTALRKRAERRQGARLTRA